MTKLTIEQQQELIPDDAVRDAFMLREDIAALPPDERERRWSEHLVSFREFLSGLDSIVF